MERGLGFDWTVGELVHYVVRGIGGFSRERGILSGVRGLLVFLGGKVEISLVGILSLGLVL